MNRKLPGKQYFMVSQDFKIYFYYNFCILIFSCQFIFFSDLFKPVRGSIHASIPEFVVDSNIFLIITKHALKINLLYNGLKKGNINQRSIKGLRAQYERRECYSYG